jgi:hypothetical protein
MLCSWLLNCEAPKVPLTVKAWLEIVISPKPGSDKLLKDDVFIKHDSFEVWRRMKWLPVNLDFAEGYLRALRVELLLFFHQSLLQVDFKLMDVVARRHRHQSVELRDHFVPNCKFE